MHDELGFEVIRNSGRFNVIAMASAHKFALMSLFPYIIVAAVITP
jgi:hypothetical protein